MQLFKPKNYNKTLADSFRTEITGVICTEEEFKRIIVKERARADRTDHHFSLIVLDLEFTDGNQSKNRLLLHKLISRMRRIDEIGWYDTRRIGIILPYTSEKGAQKFAESLCELMDPLMVQCVFRIYSYGSDRTSTQELNQELIRKGA